MIKAPRIAPLATLAALVAASFCAVLALPAGAHTAMLQASPDRNAIAGGSVTFIDLEFLDAVTNATVTVTYNGAPVAGRTTVADGEIVTFVLDQPLAQPGRYQASYEMISADGDFTTGGYFFTFDPVAEQAARIEPSDSTGFSPTVLELAAVGLAVLVAALFFVLHRVDSRRNADWVDTRAAE